MKLSWIYGKPLTHKILLQRFSKFCAHGTEMAWLYLTVFSLSDLMVHIQSGA